MSTGLLTIWDVDGDVPPQVGTVYRWNGYAESASVRSILLYVELHAERLRQRFIGWVHDLGESAIEGRTLIDRLQIENGLSFWWLTLLAEKSFYKSPISDAIRLLAIDEVIAANPPARVHLVSANRTLHATVEELCERRQIAYEWRRQPRRSASELLLEAVPHTVLALASLARYIAGHHSLFGTHKERWIGGAGTVFFCSYFDNVDGPAARAKRFHSYYWTELHEHLHRLGLKVNWLHLFVRGAGPSVDMAREWIDGFNRSAHDRESHALLESYLSWRVVGRAVRRWFAVRRQAPRSDQIRPFFRPQGCEVSLWPLLRGDWLTSVHGRVAIHNCLLIELFDSALRALPRQARGFYLWENQAWERVFAHAWHSDGHGRLAAVAHSTVRFWDLRYFADAQSSARAAMHQADINVVNNEAAIDALVATGYSRETTVGAEALRYLKGSSGAAGPAVSHDTLNVLVVTDYDRAGTDRLLSLLEEAAAFLTVPATFAVKPHPNLQVATSDYPSLKLTELRAPLADCLHQFDVAYSGNVTSAGLDAYLSGLRVIVMRDDTTLNFSPLRGFEHVQFVSEARELASALASAAPTSERTSRRYFLDDPELPRWSRLLTH